MIDHPTIGPPKRTKTHQCQVTQQKVPFGEDLHFNRDESKHAMNLSEFATDRGECPGKIQKIQCFADFPY